jgi:adenosylmethionine-8-amino-7-oxononanoate aminotransferase
VTLPLEPSGRLDASDRDLHYFTRHPRGKYVRIARAAGVYLYDDTGRAILDAAAGAAVVCLGHGNRRVIERMKAQAEQVAFAHTSAFVTVPVLELARRLAGYTPDPDARVYFVSGGSEANETAIKIHAIISRTISYHGATAAALSTSGLLQRRRPYEPILSQWPRVATCYCYRCPVGRDPALCDIECADDVERAILAHDAERIAGFIIEPVIGSSAPGVSAHRDYMRRVATMCRRHGVLMIADEIMSGVGRTGRFFAMDHYGVTPDIITLSKGISSGYFPLAAVIVAGKVFDAIRNAGTGEFVHGFTYAGNPLGAAIGLEVLDILEEEALVPRVAVLGERLLSALEPLKQFPMVGDIRGRGLLIGIELVMDRTTREPFPASVRVGQLVLQACLQEGLAVYPSTGSVNGVLGENILLAPPYIITETQIGELVEKLTRAMDRVQQQLLEAAESPAPFGPTVAGHE